MQSAKRRNMVVFHSWTHIFLITQWSCYHLTKENMKMTWKVEYSWCYGRLHIICIRYIIHSQDSMLSLDLCHVTNTQQQTKLRAWLCFQQARGCSWKGFLALLQRDRSLNCTAQQTYTTLSAVSRGVLLAGWGKVIVMPVLGCLKRPLAPWWSYCKVALLLDSGSKLILWMWLSFRWSIFSCQKSMLDKMHTR